MEPNWNKRRWLAAQCDYAWQALTFAEETRNACKTTTVASYMRHRPINVSDAPVALYCGNLGCGGAARTSILLAAGLSFPVVGVYNREPSFKYPEFLTFLLRHGISWFETQIPDCEVLIAWGPAPDAGELPASLRHVVFFANAPTEACRSDFYAWEHLVGDKLSVVRAAYSLDYTGPVVWNGAERLEYPVEKIRKRLMYRGRYAWEKNLYALIAACSGTDTEIDLFGEGPEEKGLLGAVEKWQANRLAMHAPCHDLWATGYEALILPSIMEASPSVVAEAMLDEILVVAAPVGDVPAILGQDRGILAASSKFEDLQVAIAKYRDMSDAAKEQMTKKAKSFAEKHLTANNMCRGFEHAIMGALHGESEKQAS